MKEVMGGFRGAGIELLVLYFCLIGFRGLDLLTSRFMQCHAV